jgi:hypothetical protein
MTQSETTAATPARAQPGEAANIALCVVQIHLALAFIGAASGELPSKPDMVGLYEVRR